MYYLLLVITLLIISEHLIFKYLTYRNIQKLSKTKVGRLITKPAIFMHEVVGHALPGIIVGARIRDVEIGGERGNVNASFQTNIYGTISVIIMGFGPAIILPLLYTGILILAGSCNINIGIEDKIYEIIDITKHYEGEFNDILLNRLIEYTVNLPLYNICDFGITNYISSFILVMISIIIIPGAVSSTADIKAIVEYWIENKMLTTAVILILLGLIYVLNEETVLIKIGFIITLITIIVWIHGTILTILSYELLNKSLIIYLITIIVGGIIAYILRGEIWIVLVILLTISNLIDKFIKKKE